MFSLQNLDLVSIFVRIAVLLTAMPVHEFAHAAMAIRLGDDTPVRQGRNTLSPFAHLSLMGSIALLVFGFGWAKPVQVSNRNFKHPRRDMALVALMGPVSNILLALVCIILDKIMTGFVPSAWGGTLNLILSYAISINLMLAVFNLLPVPPLDGSKILGAILPPKAYFFFARHEGVISVVLLVLMYLGVLTLPLYILSALLEALLNFITIPVDKLVAFLVR